MQQAEEVIEAKAEAPTEDASAAAATADEPAGTDQPIAHTVAGLLPESRLGPDDFQVLKVVGQGAFGKVLAVKRIRAPLSSPAQGFNPNTAFAACRARLPGGQAMSGYLLLRADDRVCLFCSSQLSQAQRLFLPQVFDRQRGQGQYFSFLHTIIEPAASHDIGP